MMKAIISIIESLGLINAADPKGVLDINTLKKNLYRKDANGKIYLAVVRNFFEKGADVGYAIEASKLPDLEHLERQSIVQASDGKPAIQLAVIVNDETDMLRFLAAATLGVINTEAHTVLCVVPHDTGINAVIPQILLSQGATVSPKSGVATDFSGGAVQFTVKAENGTEQAWTVTLYEVTDILGFSFAEQTGAATIDPVNHTVAIEVAFGTDPATLTPTITLPSGATSNPATGVETDFSNPVNVTVTNGEDSQVWTVTVSVAAE